MLIKKNRLLLSVLLMFSVSCYAEKSNETLLFQLTPSATNTNSPSSHKTAIAVKHFAYVTNFATNTVSTCPIHRGGTLAPCAASNPGFTFSGPGAITLNPTGSIAYVSNYYSNTISVCPINAYGTLETCTASSATFNGPAGITINALGTYAYITNFNNNTVSGCPLNADGSLGACTSFSDATFLYPDSIALNQSGTFAYVTNSNTALGSVSICPVNSDGTLGTCTQDSDSTFHGSAGLAINRLGTFAYIVNGSNHYSPQTVSVCPINSNGSLSACTALNSASFQGVNFGKISLNPANTLAYVANQTNNWISVCPVFLNGNFGDCVSLSDATFSQPQGVALFDFPANP
jgi:DNA-binding beta-propeller fold protein YncE